MTRVDKLKTLDRADVYKGSGLAGALSRDGSDVVFRYESSNASDSETAAIAWTIPKSRGEVRASAGSVPQFFAGLLPEGVRLQGAVAATKTSVDDHLTILLAVGVDAIGDVQVVPAGGQPTSAAAAFDPDDVEKFDLRELFERVAGADAVALDPAALPGVQAKVSAETYSTPISTRKGPAILKLAPDRGFPNLVENEHFFMGLAASCWLTVPRQTLIHDANRRSGLLVDRFLAGQGKVDRLPQEDACQVMDVYPAAKYRLKTEDVSTTLPQVCERGGGSARLAALELLRLVAYWYAIGNGDLHGKNFSIRAQTRTFGRWRRHTTCCALSRMPAGEFRWRSISMAARIDCPARTLSKPVSVSACRGARLRECWIRCAQVSSAEPEESRRLDSRSGEPKFCTNC